MARAYRTRSAKHFTAGATENARTQKARAKVEGLLEFLRGIQTADDLAIQTAKGVSFDWEGLRKFARCGSDAIHKNNPDLFSQIEAEKTRVQQITLGPDFSDTRPLGNSIDANLRAEVRKLEQKMKSKDQELNEARLTHLTLLARIEHLERELDQERRSPR
ncbi:hypothetical protein LJR030_004089 [Rhizobium sp. LjRoot30]|uniref:hypothetical protein n=1 Tax=Rhizobium sp. LjRoot30 TaxID=3342320 RepID=UPI003ECEB979